MRHFQKRVCRPSGRGLVAAKHALMPIHAESVVVCQDLKDLTRFQRLSWMPQLGYVISNSTTEL